jgi:hypothetical protein
VREPAFGSYPSRAQGIWTFYLGVVDSVDAGGVLSSGFRFAREPKESSLSSIKDRTGSRLVEDSPGAPAFCCCGVCDTLAEVELPGLVRK